MSKYTQELAEQSIIGGCLVYPKVLNLINFIPSKTFTNPTLRKYLEIIQEVHREGHQLSIEIFKLRIEDKFEEGYSVSDENLIKECVKSAYPFDKAYIKEFIKKSNLLRAKDQLKRLENESDFNNFIEKLGKIIEKLESGISENIKEFNPGSFLEKRIQIMKKREEIQKVFFGIPPIDEVIKTGLNKKEISIIASRPSIGKSLFKANLIKTQCDLGFRVASIATEQTEEVETDRIDSLLTGIPVNELPNSRFWKPGDPRFNKIKEANKYIDENWKYHLMVNRNFSTVDLAGWLRKITNEYGEVDTCYVDLFDKLTDVNVSQNKAFKVAEKLGYLNQVAEELNIHICLLVQIHREVKHSKGYRPKLWHIKDSGAYEEVARLIMLLHREKYYRSDFQDNILEVNIAKQSNGPAGDSVIIPLDVNEETLELTWEINRPHIY